MPRIKRARSVRANPSASEPPVQELSFTVPKPSGVSRKTIMWVLALVVVAGLLYITRSWYLAALVNGSPIFRWDLNRVLTARFGVQALEGIISEKLIEDEARRIGVTVSQGDIDTKTQEIIGSLGAQVNLDDVLKFQGMTKEDFNRQIRVQLYAQKILSRDLTITEEDVTGYIATQGASLVATDPARMREEARSAILDGKIGGKIQAWFAGLKEKASVTRFVQ